MDGTALGAYRACTLAICLSFLAPLGIKDCYHPVLHIALAVAAQCVDPSPRNAVLLWAPPTHPLVTGVQWVSQ